MSIIDDYFLSMEIDMLLKKNKSCLVIIDMQEKLAPLVFQSPALIAQCMWLTKLAAELEIPQIITEQYPSGLDVTLKDLHSLIPNKKVIEKVHFSCWGEERFRQALQELNKEQIILIGIESHVCVLQTALDLIAEGYKVFAIVDAVSSRHEIDYKYALKRMKQAGVQLLTSEMVFFEWVEKAGNSQFKTLSKHFLQKKGT